MRVPSVTQRKLDLITSSGRWEWNKSSCVNAWMPFEGTHRWKSPRDNLVFAQRRIVLLGSSPTRQLAIHYPMMASGRIPSVQLCEWHDTGNTLYTSCHRGTASTGFSCGGMECNSGNSALGFSCDDCFCCCNCTKTYKRCGYRDFVISPLVGINRSANQDTFNTSIEFSWKPETVHAESDRIAFHARYCMDPPDLLVVHSKGVHDAYFDDYTLLPNVTRRAGKFGDTGERISTGEFAKRMNAALRRYAPNLGCLPARTVVLWVTPYASNKVPWQQRLVDAARNETLKAFAAGVFSEHVLLLDAWALTASPGAPKTTDGNHRVATFQTTLWGLIRSAFQWRVRELHLPSSSSAAAAVPGI